MKPAFFKRDSWFIGIFIGMILPILLFLILYLLDLGISEYFGLNLTNEFHYLYLLSLIANFYPIRHYLIKLRFEKTGFGLLLITIVEILTYFYSYYDPS